MRFFSVVGGSAARPLGIRMGAAQHDRPPERRLRRADGADPRPDGGRDPRLGASRSRKPGQRRVRRGPDVVRGRPPGGVAQRGLAIVPRVGAVDALDRPGDADQASSPASPSPPLELSRGVRGRATRRRDAAFELPGRHVLDERRRAVDELADRCPSRQAPSCSFFYRDTRAGVATLTAEAPGTTQASTRGDGRRRRRRRASR